MKHFSFTLLRSFIVLMLIATFAYRCEAATKYVSNTGSNSNSGSSWAQAWLTLQFAANNIAAGDSVLIADGTYTGFNHGTTGTATNPIVYIAAGNNVVINLPCNTTDGINIEGDGPGLAQGANYIEINGVRVINQPRNGIRLVYAHHCIVRNTYCENNFERGIFTGFTDDLLLEYNECLESIDEHGIYVSNSSDRSIIRYNICHHNTRGGIQINADASQGGDGISTDPEIYGNILYENGVGGGAAINLDGVQSAFIYNNLLYENHASGIALFQQDGAQPSINATIVHNTIINANDARWCILAVNGSSGAQVFNNILINQHPWRGSIALDSDAVPGFNSDYNILVNSLSNTGDGSTMTLAQWQLLGYDENSMLADPMNEIFVSPGSDYHLIAGSQAINAGNGDFAFGVDVDIEGTPRPQSAEHDIGAYEASGILAIDEEEENVGVSEKENPGITINQEIISWRDGLEGKMNLMNIEGKVIRYFDISEIGEFSLRELVPGIYVAMVYNEHGVQWSGWIVRWGDR